MTETVMTTLEERENFMKVKDVRHPGFLPKPIQKLIVKKPPKSIVNIECNHFLRLSTQEFTHGYPTVKYKLWQEAGKIAAPFPQRPDESFNANVWRNFRRQYGLHTTGDQSKIPDIIASMYLINIPAPSKIGEQTFEKYIRETKLFQSEKLKNLALSRTKADIEEFRRLRILSQSRNPPIDEKGNIMPPENFKKYAYCFVPQPELPPTPPPPIQKTDSLGQRYVPKSRPHLWKLSYKLNNPKYENVIQDIQKQVKERQRTPGMSPGYQIMHQLKPLNPPATV